MGTFSSNLNFEDNPQCGDGEIASLWVNILSVFMILAVICSYAPKVRSCSFHTTKHYRIIKLRSSTGYSHYYFLLGVCSSSSTLVTSIIIQWSLFICCIQEVKRLVSVFPRTSSHVCYECLALPRFLLKFQCFFSVSGYF